MATKDLDFLSKFINEEVKKLHSETLLKEEEIGGGINSVKLADALVASGVIKEEYTDISGVKSSSKLAFIINDILNKI